MRPPSSAPGAVRGAAPAGPCDSSTRRRRCLGSAPTGSSPRRTPRLRYARLIVALSRTKRRPVSTRFTRRGYPVNRAPRVGGFTADLAPLNQDGEGVATLAQTGTNVSVHLRASGLDGGVHVAHIHGLRQAQNECPTLARDVDGNGLVDPGEGLPLYGPVQVTLNQGPTARGTTARPACSPRRSVRCRSARRCRRCGPWQGPEAADGKCAAPRQPSVRSLPS